MAFGLFKKKKKENKQDDRYQTLRIKEVVPVAKEAVNLVFEKPEAPFNYEPGQFITIIKEIAGKKVRRAYSLCTSPFTDDYPAVTVKRVPGGIMSNYINDECKAGDELEIMEPMGMFTTPYDSDQSRQLIMIGGGSGITPLIAIMKSVLVKEPESQVSLIYCNRNQDYIIFKNELEQLSEKYSDRCKVVHILEDNASSYGAYVGRLTNELLGTITSELKASDSTEFFICGPEPMMDIAKAGLKVVGISDEKIRLESFDAGKNTSAAASVASSSESGSTKSSVTILLDGEEHTISVDKQVAILDAGLDNDLDMPYSCQSGLCTACRGKCLEGEIDQGEAEGLSQQELDDGYVLLCVGKPKSDTVKVEVE